MTDYRSGSDEAFIGERGGEPATRDGLATFSSATASARAAAASVKEVAEVAVGEARERVRALAGATTDKVQQRYGDLEAWVQLQPARALGIAAAAGVVLGLLLRGRTTRDVYRRDP